MKELKKVDPIQKGNVEQYTKLKKELTVVEDKIANRVEYIYDTIFKKVFKRKAGYCFYVYGAADEEIGDISKAIDGEQCGFTIEQYNHFTNDGGLSNCLVLLNGGEWDLYDSFPTRWLYEDFEEELIAGKKAYEDKLMNDKLQAQQKEQRKEEKKKELLKSAKSKLSKAELKAIGLSK